MDIQTQFIDFTQGADYQADVDGLAEDDGLTTAVLISLFTDAHADSPLDAGEAGNRGWWGDKFAPQAGDQIGSQLWRLSREKDRPQALIRTKAYAEHALKWLIDDGLASQVQIIAWRERRDVLALQVVIGLSDGAKKQFQFQF